MNPSSPLFLLLFLSLFEAIGGAAAGSAIRNLRAGRLSALFGLAWGFFFGGIPTAISFFFLVQANLLYRLVGPAIFFGALLITAFLWQGLLADIGIGTFTTVGMGAVFLAMGLGVGSYVVLHGQTLFGVVWGGMFAFVGGGMLWAGLSALLHGRSLDEPAPRPASK